MSQRILTIVFFILLITLGILYFFYDKQLHQNDIKGFESSISETESEDFQDFLYENVGKFVKLSLTLSPDMTQDVLKGMDSENRIIFTAKDGENQDQTIQYMIRLLDDGRRDFEFDPKTGKLNGFFKTNRRVSPSGEPIINLISIPSNLVPKLNKN